MKTLSCSLALLAGVIGAGFSSGREIAYFFAAFGAAAPLSAAAACLSLLFLFLRLPAQMIRCGADTLPALCRIRFGRRFGRFCAGLFALLAAVTGGAMLAACAELFALTLPLRGAYPLGMLLSLVLGACLCARGLNGIALPGLALCLLLPVLLIHMLALPAGEAGFFPRQNVLGACVSGIGYAALNAAMLCGALPLLPRETRARRRAVLLFTLLFSALLTLGTAVLLRHRQAALSQPLPFVFLSKLLGKRGFLLCAGSMYFAALSTLCAMLAALRHMRKGGLLLPAAACLLFACFGFGDLVSHGYPMLGLLCACLLGLCCLPVQSESPSAG